jgi:hypothetical protein
MKKILVALLFVGLVTGVFSCRKKGEMPPDVKLGTELLKDTTTVSFLDSVLFRFDTIVQNDKVEHTFRIKNTGDKNFVIANAIGSCGCTVPEYPKDPVKPGDTAAIHVTFNSAGKQGEQHKTVTLICNTANRNEILNLTGFVKTKE